MIVKQSEVTLRQVAEKCKKDNKICKFETARIIRFEEEVNK